MACMGEEWNVYRISMEKPEGKRPLESPNIDGSLGSVWILGRLAGAV
jgi:hypothetical protein